VLLRLDCAVVTLDCWWFLEKMDYVEESEVLFLYFFSAS
jgi:hypothetical protein